MAVEVHIQKRNLKGWGEWQKVNELSPGETGNYSLRGTKGIQVESLGPRIRVVVNSPVF